MRRVRFAIALGVLALAGCVGPAAPDAVLCQDVIHRLCLSPRCAVVDDQLSVGDDCNADLLARTGCGDLNFRFTTPSRDRVLACRDPLVSDGDHTNDKPTCAQVEETLSCADLEDFLNGSTP